jgi:hypothetical protein
VFTAGAVVNWLWKLASTFPDRSVRPLVASTVIVLEDGNPPEFRVTTWLSAEVLIESPNGVPFASTAKFVVLIVLGFSDFENVSTTTAFGPTPVDPFCGVMIDTTGAVVSVPAPVVNVLENELPALPDRSKIPEVTCTVTFAFPGKGESGVNVTTAPVTSRA